VHSGSSGGPPTSSRTVVLPVPPPSRPSDARAQTLPAFTTRFEVPAPEAPLPSFQELVGNQEGFSEIGFAASPPVRAPQTHSDAISVPRRRRRIGKIQ